MKTTVRQFALDLNREESGKFTAPDADLARRRYLGQHRTQLIAFKCMDGRVNMSLMTNTPPGIIKPYRNIGGKFNLGWPYLGELIRDDVLFAADEGRDTIVFFTYHFSAGNEHRGCAGFGYDTEAARAATEALKEQSERVFGIGHTTVYPIVVGIETDEDALTLHGVNGTTLAVADIADASKEVVEQKLLELFPDMYKGMRADLLPIVRGNQEHILEVRASGRQPIELDHRENIIGVGRGFHWLHVPNRALLIGPYGHAWDSAVQTAGKIVKGNMEAGRIDAADGVLLLTSALSRFPKGSSGWLVAEEKARYMAETAEEILREAYPEFELDVLAGVVDERTLLFHPLDEVA